MTQFDNLLFQIPGVEPSQGQNSSEWLWEVGTVSLINQNYVWQIRYAEIEKFDKSKLKKTGMQEKSPLPSEEKTAGEASKWIVMKWPLLNYALYIYFTSIVFLFYFF